MIDFILGKIQVLVSWLFPIHVGSGTTCDDVDEIDDQLYHSEIYMNELEQLINDTLIIRSGNKSIPLELPRNYNVIPKIDNGEIQLVTVSVPPKSEDSIVTLHVSRNHNTVKLPYSLFKELFDLVER